MYRYSLSFLILRDYRLVTKEERKSQANSPLVIIKYARINAKVARPAFFPNERVSDFSRFQKFLYRHIGCFEAKTRLFRSPIADNARALVGNVVRAFENEVSCVVVFFSFFFVFKECAGLWDKKVARSFYFARNYFAVHVGILGKEDFCWSFDFDGDVGGWI